VEEAGGGSLRAALEVEFPFELPAAIDPERAARSRERAVSRVRVRVTLTSGSPLVEVGLRVDNRACDHRLRALFPAGVRSRALETDGHFRVGACALDRPPAGDWSQPPPETHPQQEFALVREAGRGLAVLVRGLPEVAAIEARGELATGIALTLLRCVGWLSRDDFDERRRRNAGPTIHTPEAQCPGWHAFHYAVLPLAGAAAGDRSRGAEGGAAGAPEEILAIKALSARFRSPLLTKQGVVDPAVPAEGSLLELREGRAAISAVKRHEARDSLVVRLYNPVGDPLRERLIFTLPVRSAWRVNLLEEREEAHPVEGRRELRLELRPHEIVTLELEFAPPGP
jgi:alpha-mannosidase